MNTVTPNPPAFPCQDIIERNAKGQLVGHEISGAGMTLRDYFAAEAMNGMMSLAGDEVIPTNVDHVAQVCYSIADAMLKARTA